VNIKFVSALYSYTRCSVVKREESRREHNGETSRRNIMAENNSQMKPAIEKAPGQY
jgi:hypothetical protein